MVSKYKERITITLPKGQLSWLKKTAKIRKIKASEIIKECLQEYRNKYYVEDHYLSNEEQNLNNQELEQMIKIAKFNWLDD